MIESEREEMLPCASGMNLFTLYSEALVSLSKVDLIIVMPQLFLRTRIDTIVLVPYSLTQTYF
jgi:hypothetical protein